MKKFTFILKNEWGGKSRRIKNWFPKHIRCTCLDRLLKVNGIKEINYKYRNFWINESIANILKKADNLCANSECENKNNKFFCNI